MEETLKVRVTADTSQFSAAMEGAKNKVRSFRADTDNLKIKAAWGDEMAKNAKKAGLSFNDIKKRIKAVADTMGGSMTQATELVGLQVDKLANHWGEASVAAESAGQSAMVAGEEAAAAAEAAGTAIRSALGVIGLILAAISAIILAIKKIKEAQDAVFKKIIAGFKKAAEIIWTVIKTVDGALITAVKKAAEAVQSLINKIMSGDLDNLYNWAKTSGNAVADSMDRINSALINAKNGVAALLAPLVNSLAPVLDWIVDKFVTLINVVSRFFAALGGKATYISVQKAAVSYGEAAAGAMNGATEAAQAYKREVMGFDEINKLPAPDTGSGGGGSGGGGGGGSSAGSMFEELATGSTDAGQIFKDFLDKVEAGLPKFDQALKNTAQEINTWAGKFVEVFGDEGIKKRVVDVTTQIVNSINGFINDINFELVGQALGAGIDLALDFLVTAIGNFKWGNLGKKLADLVNGLTSKISADNLGSLLVAPWNVAWQTLSGFVNGLKWGDLAIKLGDTINKALQKIDIKSFITTVEGVLNGATIFIKNLTAKIEWDNMSSKLSELGIGLCDAIIKYLPDLTQSALQFASKLIAAIKTALNSAEMKQKIAEAAYYIVDAFCKLKDKYDEFKSIFNEAIFSALTGAFLAWYENSPLKKFVEWIRPDLATVFEKLKAEFVEGGKDSSKGYEEGVNGSKPNINTYKTNVGKEEDNLTATSKKKGKEAGAGYVNSQQDQLNTKGIKFDKFNKNFNTSAVSAKDNASKQGTTIGGNVEASTQTKLDNSSASFGKFGTSLLAKVGLTGEGSGATVAGNVRKKLQSVLDEAKNPTGFGKFGTSLLAKVGATGEGSGATVAGNVRNKLQNVLNGTNPTKFGTFGTTLLGKVGATGEGSGSTLAKNVTDKLQSKLNASKSPISFATTGKTLAAAVGKTGQGAGTTIGNNIVNAIKAKLNTDITVTGKIVGSSGGHYAFASGGYPATGQMFIAREAGPELVGSIGGRSAVVNNDQIVASVSQGVAKAVASVIGGGGGGSQVNVYMDSQLVAKAANKGNALLNRRFDVYAT